MTRLVLIAVLGLGGWGAAILPAQALGLGFSLPKFRALRLEAPGSAPVQAWGLSAQVLGGTGSLFGLALDGALDYGFVRDFAAAGQGRPANYAFFDLGVGVGQPLAVAPLVTLTPGVEGHGLLFVASPQDLAGPGWGLGPRLALGYAPAANLILELSGSQVFLGGLSGRSPVSAGALTTVRLDGTYTF